MNFTCPTCGVVFHVDHKEDAVFRPFCSQRCKFVDLGRWLDGTYNISEPLPETQQQSGPSEIPTESED